MNDAQAPRVMLATAFGPSKDYCRPFWRQVVEGMQGIDALAVLFDGTKSVPVLPMGMDVYQSSLPRWTGGNDPHRYGRLARMRTALRETFLSSDCDYLYWHDVDTIPPVDIIPRLLALDVPVATGAYSYRELDHAMQPILHCRQEDVTADLQHCEGYGMGCMLVRRDVMAATEFRSPEYWSEHPEGLGEDWQWGLDSGVETVVDTRLSCWHCGEDGTAGRIVFGECVYAVVWLGEPKVVTNEFGEWKHGAVRVDLTPEQASVLPPGFARSMARSMSLDWEDTVMLVEKSSSPGITRSLIAMDGLRSVFRWPDEKPAYDRNVEGWLTSGTADALRARLTGCTCVVELGSWLGMSAHFMAVACDAHILCIDTWEGSQEHEEDPHCAAILPTLYERFLANTWDLRNRLTPIRRESVNGLIVLASFGVEPDLIYIDAAHDYESVMADIKAARELFPEAVLVGDDWGIPGVQSAASEMLGALPGFGHNDCCWWLDRS